MMDQQLLLHPNADPAELGPCIEACERCHRICLRAAMRFALEQGGSHTEPEYFRLLIACEIVSRLTADSLLAGLPLYEHVCALCARICRDCAGACSQVEAMEECSAACTDCAERCEVIAASRPTSPESTPWFTILR